MQKGTGTVTKVIDAGLCQPSVRVKWDGGRSNTYFTGASVSRNAMLRPLHPEPAQVRPWRDKAHLSLEPKVSEP